MNLRMLIVEALNDYQEKLIRSYVYGGRHDIKTLDDSKYFKEIIPIDYNTGASHEKVEFPAHIAKHLNDAGYKTDDYSSGMVQDKYDRPVKINKALTASKAPQSYIDEVNNDPKRLSSMTKSKQHQIVISNHPYDVGGMSTDRGWTSCMTLPSRKDSSGGGQNDYIRSDIEYNTHVAYLTKTGDDDIKNPIARIAIKKFTSELPSGETHDIYRPEHKEYGDSPNSGKFLKAVSDWSSKKYPMKKDHFRYTMPDELYNDTHQNEYNFDSMSAADFKKLDYDTSENIIHSMRPENAEHQAFAAKLIDGGVKPSGALYSVLSTDKLASHLRAMPTTHDNYDSAIHAVGYMANMHSINYDKHAAAMAELIAKPNTPVQIKKIASAIRGNSGETQKNLNDLTSAAINHLNKFDHNTPPRDTVAIEQAFNHLAATKASHAPKEWEPTTEEGFAAYRNRPPIDTHHLQMIHPDVLPRLSSDAIRHMASHSDMPQVHETVLRSDLPNVDIYAKRNSTHEATAPVLLHVLSKIRPDSPDHETISLARSAVTRLDRLGHEFTPEQYSNLHESHKDWLAAFTDVESNMDRVVNDPNVPYHRIVSAVLDHPMYKWKPKILNAVKDSAAVKAKPDIFDQLSDHIKTKTAKFGVKFDD